MYSQILDTVWDNGRVRTMAAEDYKGFVAELVSEIESEAFERGADEGEMEEAVLFALQHVAEVTQETVEEYASKRKYK